MITCIDCGNEVERTSSTQKRCSDCAARAKREYYANNREAIRERHARYHTENRESVLERKREYYAENREIVLEKVANYRAANREFIRRQKSKRYAENREVIAEYAARRRDENREADRARKRRWERENISRAGDRRREQRVRDAAIDANRSSLPWTAAEDAVVMSWAEGLRELGAVLGRTAPAVGDRRRKLRRRLAAQSASNEGDRS